MKSAKMSTIVVLALGLMVSAASVAHGRIHLTVNGQPIDSITLELGQSCTVEVVSDDSMSYKAYVGFDNRVVLGTFSHLKTTEAAGSAATVKEYNEKAFYGYEVVAAGVKFPPSKGVHFVFEYEAQQVGETDLKLYHKDPPPSPGTLLDSVRIKVTTPPPPPPPEPMGTAFTYQGRLLDEGSPADGLYDFKFKLYDNPGPLAVQEGNTIDINDLDVIDGQFVVGLDFGSDVFAGDARWLEIGVRPGDSSGGFTTLSPRQEITPVPYALHASSSKVKQLIADFVVASGESVTAGDVVSFLEGYIQKGSAAGYGSEYVFNSAATQYISVAALSETKFVVAYRDGGNCPNYCYGTAVIGEISGNSITYGSEYVFNQYRSFPISVAALSSTKFVVAYRGDYGTAVIGDVSGNSITYGSEYVFNEATSYFISVAALSSTEFVVAYMDNQNYGYGTAVIGDVSGNSITYGSEYVFNQAGTEYISAAALSQTKFVVAYQDYGNSYYGTAVIGDVSGNTISYGSEHVFNPAFTEYISAAALSSTKFVVAYCHGGTSNYGAAVIGDVSGNSITYGSEYVFNFASSIYISAGALSSTKFVVAYGDGGNFDYGTSRTGNVSGKSITYGLRYVFNHPTTHNNSVAALSETKFVVAYWDSGISGYGFARIGTAIGGIVGIAKESAAAGPVPVIIDGISDVHSGLIPGEVYFSDIAGDLTTDSTDYRVGLAISSTEILLDR